MTRNGFAKGLLLQPEGSARRSESLWSLLMLLLLLPELTSVPILRKPTLLT